jgi:GNAT superfamily N-acetyltransferase
MTAPIRIDYLKNHQETIPMWTEHFWSEWNMIYRGAGRSYQQVRSSIEGRCHTDSIPLAIVALSGSLAVGTGCIKDGDLDERSDLGPWLAGIYVVPEFRRRGIGSQIALHLEIEALRLGHSTLYLWTPSSEALYASLGWAVHERIRHFGQPITIMTKKTEQAACTQPSVAKAPSGE